MSRRIAIALALFSGLLFQGYSQAIEVPATVPTHGLVVARHKVGASVWVLTVRNGMLARVESYKAPDALVFTGPPGVYTLIGTEDGKDFQEFVTIGGSGPGPPPDPDDPPVFEDTTYDVGPHIRWYLSRARVTVQQAKKASAVFVDASAIAGRIQQPLEDINRKIEQGLTTAGIPATAIQQYGELMGKRWDEGKFRSTRDHAFAWWEVAEWLDDSLKGTKPEWLQ